MISVPFCTMPTLVARLEYLGWRVDNWEVYNVRTLEHYRLSALAMQEGLYHNLPRVLSLSAAQYTPLEIMETLRHLALLAESRGARGYQSNCFTVARWRDLVG